MAELLFNEYYNNAYQNPKIQWNEPRPAQMLGLDKEQYKRLVLEQWDIDTLKKFLFLKKNGYPLHKEIHTLCCQVKYRTLLEIEAEPQINLMKTIRYIVKQRKKDKRCSFHLLQDYWRMGRPLGYNFEQFNIQFPQNLFHAHENVLQQSMVQKEQISIEKMNHRYVLLSKYAWSQNDILIRPAKSESELQQEGIQLSHCVARYAKMMEQGKTALFFIRKKEQPEIPWFTLELQEDTLEVRQNRGKYNQDPPEEVTLFQRRWLEYIRKIASKQNNDNKRRGAA